VFWGTGGDRTSNNAKIVKDGDAIRLFKQADIPSYATGAGVEPSKYNTVGEWDYKITNKGVKDDRKINVYETPLASEQKFVKDSSGEIKELGRGDTFTAYEFPVNTDGELKMWARINPIKNGSETRWGK